MFTTTFTTYFCKKKSLFTKKWHDSLNSSHNQSKTFLDSSVNAFPPQVCNQHTGLRLNLEYIYMLGKYSTFVFLICLHFLKHCCNTLQLKSPFIEYQVKLGHRSKYLFTFFETLLQYIAIQESFYRIMLGKIRTQVKKNIVEFWLTCDYI